MLEARKLPQCVAAFLAAGSSLAIGMMLGWTSPVESRVKEGFFGFTVNDEEFSWISAMLPLGAAVACIPSGFMVDAIGRKLILVLSAIPLTIGWLFIVFANHSIMLYIGRVILGAFCGATSTSIPLYIGEIAQKEIRGALGSFFQLGFTLGVLIVYVVGAFSDPVLLTLVCAVIPLIISFFMIFVPESPVYLIAKGDDYKAAKSLSWLRGKLYDSKAELMEFQADIAKGKEYETSFFSGFKNRACFRGLYISLGLMFFEQFSGIYAILFYLTTIFKLSGSSLEPRFSTMLIGFVQVLATVLTVFFVDKLGRRLLLLISAALMAFSTLTLGLYFYYRDKDESYVKDLGWIPLTALCLFIVMFSLGFGTVCWLMIGELFPSNVKGPAGALAITTNWLMAFVVSKTYVDLNYALGVGMTYLLFAGITFLGFLFVLFFVPETKGKSLAEIQEILSK